MLHGANKLKLQGVYKNLLFWYRGSALRVDTHHTLWFNKISPAMVLLNPYHITKKVDHA
jgi:hypothetical protein